MCELVNLLHVYSTACIHNCGADSFLCVWLVCIVPGYCLVPLEVLVMARSAWSPLQPLHSHHPVSDNHSSAVGPENEVIASVSHTRTQRYTLSSIMLLQTISVIVSDFFVTHKPPCPHRSVYWRVCGISSGSRPGGVRKAPPGQGLRKTWEPGRQSASRSAVPPRLPWQAGPLDWGHCTHAAWGTEDTSHLWIR